MEPSTKQLIDECLRQVESCKYTSTTYYIWLRSIKFWRKAYIVLPIIFGSLATWSILTESRNETLNFFAAGCALLAALIPAIHKALNIEIDINCLSDSAAEYKRLQDRFRLAANVKSLMPPEEFEREVLLLMDEHDSARSDSLTPPERFFKEAQKKIDSGDYNFDVDLDK